MTYSQHGRPLTVSTPLGEDRFLLTGVTGREEVSVGYSFRLDLLSERHDVRPGEIIGRPVSFAMRMANGAMRITHGRVARFWYGWTTPENLRRYWAEVVPWFAFLASTRDSRIYRNLSVPRIAEQIFQRHGFADYDTSLLREEHRTLEYSVQHQESCYDYLCRLFEEEGIFFFFRHSEDRHTLVLADSNLAFQDGPETDLAYDETENVLGTVKSWMQRIVFQPLRYATGDYNHETPGAMLNVERGTLMQRIRGLDFSEFEHFEWPGGYPNRDIADRTVLRRLQEMETNFYTAEGTSSCPGFAAGTRFRLAHHPDPKELGTPFFLLSVEHEARDTGAVTRDAAGDGTGYIYANRFTAFPVYSRVSGMEKPYRPPRRTPKPRVQGSQTAVVVGPPGETIHCDDQGRVKVQFHWDRHGRKDDSSSCWVRVSEAWAGAKYGTMHLPHVGQEVIVSFLDGDPDRPLIIGRVYNSGQNHPLTAEGAGGKTRSITRDQGGNHILTEGKEGMQRVELHSPGGSSHMQIGTVTSPHPASALMALFEGAASMLTASASGWPGFSVSTAGDTAIQCLGSAHYQTGGNRMEAVMGNSTSLVMGNHMPTVTGNQIQTIAGNSTTTVTGNATSITAGNTTQTTAGDTTQMTAGDSSFWTIGNSSSGVLGNNWGITIGHYGYTYLQFTSEIKLAASLAVASGTETKIGSQYEFIGASKSETTASDTSMAAAKQTTSADTTESALAKTGSTLMDEQSGLTSIRNSQVNLANAAVDIGDRSASINSAAAAVNDGFQFNL